MNTKTYKEINRSPFFYVGDKFKLVPQLLDNFPVNINRFIEPFCGGGSVFLNVNAKECLVNDIDTYMIKLHHLLIKYSCKQSNFWKDVEMIIYKYGLSAKYLGRNVPQELKKEYVKTYFAKYNKEAYMSMRNEFNINKCDMLLLYLLLIYGFNRMMRFNRKGDFNIPVGNVDFNQNVVTALNNYFDRVLINNIKFFNMDFEKFIEKTNPMKDDFIYLDPPYLITFSEYNKLWNEESELRLIKCLDKLNEKGIKFAVSNVIWHKERYNDIFNEWAQRYNMVKINSNYISYHDNTNKKTIEVLVKNF